VKVPYGEGVASHTGPALCGCNRKDAFEALTGEDVGKVLSREIMGFGVPTLSRKWKAILTGTQTQEPVRLREVVDPWHASKHSVRESGYPAASHDVGISVVRAVNPME